MRGIKRPAPHALSPMGTPSRFESEWTLHLQLATPMFGGGWKAGDTDTVTPLSGKAVRGHLRSWWRLVVGHQYGAAMRLWEEAIFGSDASPSPLDVVVEVTSDVVPRSLGEHPTPYGLGGDCRYALFPAIERRDDQNRSDPVQALVREGLQFSVRLRWPSEAALTERRSAENAARLKRSLPRLPPMNGSEFRDHLSAAVWGWSTLGGLGARTRRGLGAITSVQPTGAAARVVSGLRILTGPSLGADLIAAWLQSVNAYQKFRQNRADGGVKQQLYRDKVSGQVRVKDGFVPAGKSRWPEPDSIRRLTTQSLHPNERTLRDKSRIRFHDHRPSPGLCEFPRAALGLPIVFHFSDGNKGPVTELTPRIPAGELDPDDATLDAVLVRPNGTRQLLDRMASPVITRPVKIGNAWHSAFIFLPNRPPANLAARLTTKVGGSFDVAPAEIRSPGMLASPLRSKAGAIEALEDFLTVEMGYIPFDAAGLV